MKLSLLLIPLLFFMTSCTIDWNDEKDKKIAELQKQIQDDIFRKQKDCSELFDKNKESTYWNDINYNFVNIFYSKTKSSCYAAYSIRTANPSSTQFRIDDLLTKDTTFTSTLIMDNLEEEQAEWKRFYQKIEELKWE